MKSLLKLCADVNGSFSPNRPSDGGNGCLLKVEPELTGP